MDFANMARGDCSMISVVVKWSLTNTSDYANKKSKFMEISQFIKVELTPLSLLKLKPRNIICIVG